ncbi:MAG: type VI secretion system ImpA family N-terminal domain-containing protein, partial [Planctomycetota bacterium]
MPLSADIDPDIFSDPISGDFPAGENLQRSEEGRAARSALRDLREEARRIERRADDGDSSEGGWAAARSVWVEVRDGGLDILRNRSRDLDIAAMTIEALARTDGFIGLAAGFAMTRVMVESSWSDLFPIPDPEDGPADDEAVVEERTLPLQRLVGMDSEGLLVPAILHIPLTQSRSDEQYAICHWRSSRDLAQEQSEEKLKLAVERGAVSPAQFEQAVATTPLPHLKEVYLELCQVAEQWELLSSAVSTASGGSAVLPAGPIRDLFEECDAA